MIDKPFTSNFESVKDMQPFVGKEIGISSWLTIDQKCINQFSTLTKDEQWIHTDPERCAKFSPFKKPIANGFLVLSFCTHLIESCVELKGIKMGVNYGFDKIRFTNVVTVGSRIRGRFKLLELTRRVDQVKFKYGVTIEVEGEEKPAIVAEWIGLVYV